MRALIEPSLWQKKWDQSATGRTRDHARDAPALVADKNVTVRSRDERTTTCDLSCRKHDAFGASVVRQDRTCVYAFATLTISSIIFAHARADAMFRPEIAQETIQDTIQDANVSVVIAPRVFP